MATDNRLTARIPDRHVDGISSVADDRDIADTEAERVVVREGLASLGYEQRRLSAEDLLLEYARKMGSVLGLVGLILIGYGVFGAPMFRWAGFSLVFVGFAFFAGAEFGPALKGYMEGDGDE